MTLRGGLSRLARARSESIAAHMVTSFLVLALVVVGLVATAAMVVQRRIMGHQARSRLEAVVDLKEAELNRWVADQQNRLVLLAGIPSVRAAAARSQASGPGKAEAVAGLQDVVARATQSGSDLQEVFILSAVGGRVVASSDPRQVGSYRVDDLYFREGQRGTFVQNVYPSTLTASPTLTIATPVLDEREERTVGVLAAHLNLANLDKILNDRVGLGPSAQALAVNRHYELISSERFGSPELSRGLHTVAVERALRRQSGTAAYLNPQGVPVIGAYRWIPERELALIVEESRDDAYAGTDGTLVAILAVGMLTTLALLLGVRRIAVRLTEPLGQLSSGAEKVASGDFGVTVPEQGRDEIGTLARSFNSMTLQLRHLYADLQGQMEVTQSTLTALREGQALLAGIVDNSSALIGVMGPGGRLVLANEALERTLGLDRGKAGGRRLGDFLTPMQAARHEEAERRVVELDTTVDGELEVVEPGGETRTFRCVWFPLPDERGSAGGVGFIATDITERITAEEERKRFEAQLRHAQKLESLGVLAGGIAHDFNNILAAILGYADLAREAAEPMSEPAEHMEQVVLAAQRAAHLTNQMLAYAGRASLHVEVLDLNQAVEELWSLLSVSTAKKITLVKRLSPDRCSVSADPAQVSQVVMNLVTNAAQAIGEEVGTVSVQTGIEVVRTAANEGARLGPGRYVRLTVSDTGCGMDEGTLERIFDPFFTTKESGRGLGLAAVLGIVNGLGGAVRVESAPGRGTTFEVLFPEGTGSPRSAPPTTEVGFGTDQATVLLVDDEEAVRGFTRRALERAGTTVIEAADGVEAVRLLEAEGDRLTAVILDMSMPGMSGEEVFVEIRKRHDRLPVIFITGYDPEDALSGLTSEVGVRCLQKPFRPRDLTALVAEAVGGRTPVVV